MQVSGRTIIIGTLLLALAMSGGAWWYQYSLSRRAAAFWGKEAATLLAGRGRVALLELETSDNDATKSGPRIAGRVVVKEHDLSDKPGLVHLRHALTQDANFMWDLRSRESVQTTHDWAYAIRFGDGEELLFVLLRRDFKQIGKLVDGDAENVELLPAPRLGPVFTQYLSDIGVIKSEPPPTTAR